MVFILIYQRKPYKNSREFDGSFGFLIPIIKKASMQLKAAD